MKKTLIALAVMAASGASFAQVSLTGLVGFGFQKSASQTDSNNNLGSGMTTVDGTINFTAKEDLGGGMSAIASTEIQLRGRTNAAINTADQSSNAFRPRNSSLAMITPMGVFSAGSIESPTGFFRTTSYGDNFQSGLDGANGPWDGKINIDFVRYMVPVGPMQLSAWYTEVGSGIGNSVALVNASKITAPVLMANFASGPISAYADWTLFSSQRSTVVAPTGATAAQLAGVAAANAAPVYLDGVNRYRIGGDYDFGIAKVSLGYQARDKGFADQYAVGLTVPLGAITMNLTYGYRNSTNLGASGDALLQSVLNPGYTGTADARSGTALQVKYNFSKSTFAELNYAMYTGGGKVGVGSPANASSNDYSDEYRIRLAKSF